MSRRTEILAVIERTLERGIEPYDETRDAKIGHTFGAHLRKHAAVKYRSVDDIRELLTLIENDPELGWLCSAQFPCGPGPTSSDFTILPVKITGWLLAKSLALEGKANAALNTLEKFAETNAADGIRVVAVYGVDVRAPVQITEDVSLLPLDAMWPSLGIDHLVQVFGEVAHHHLPLGRDEKEAARPALSFVAERFSMSPAVRRQGEALPKWFRDHEAAFGRLVALAQATALMPETAPQLVGRWVDVDGVDTVPGLTGGASGDVEFMEIIPRRFKWLRPLQIALAADRLGRFHALRADAQARISVPLHRLALSEARRTLVDRSLELGIALEALFEDGSQSEIAHKIATRGALYTAPPQERKSAFRILKAAYSLRSQAAHRGVVDTTIAIDGVRRPSEDVLRDAASICRAALNRIVDSGNPPDWAAIDLGIN